MSNIYNSGIFSLPKKNGKKKMAKQEKPDLQ